MFLKRYNEDIIRKDLAEKMVFISGPRQVGKTTLAQSFLTEDQEGYQAGLWYLRDVTKREVDFFFTIAGKPWFAVECKKGNKASNAALIYFGTRLKIPFLYQVTYQGKDDILSENVRVLPAAKFLAALPGCVF